MLERERFMKKIQLLVVFGTFFIFPSFVSYGLDIPLSGPSSSSGKSGGKIGYIDLDRIYQIFPETVNAQEDYMKQLNAKKEALAKKQKDLENIESKIAVLENTLKDAPAVDPSSSSQGDVLASTDSTKPPQSLAELKIQLERDKKAYEESKQRAYEELTAYEKAQSQTLLGKIYQALKDLAQEEQVDIVVDKASILFGSADIDLTEKLQNKVRGY